MRLGLIAEKYIDNDLEHNFGQMRSWLHKCAGQGYDLLCFGESFAHSFEALTWDIEQDRHIAIPQNDPAILQLQEDAGKAETGIAFGYIEREGSQLYSSYMVISAKGEQLANFRRLSPGWKEHIANPLRYVEGSDLTTFQLAEKTIGIAICGDLWHEELLNKFIAQPSDVLLWPLYINFTPDDWYGGERQAYAERVVPLQRPVLMINCLSDPPTQAFGGAYHFEYGQIKQELPLGQGGILSVEL